MKYSAMQHLYMEQCIVMLHGSFAFAATITVYIAPFSVRVVTISATDDAF